MNKSPFIQLLKQWVTEWCLINSERPTIRDVNRLHKLVLQHWPDDVTITKAQVFSFLANYQE
jgi:hypothetical protein